MKKRFLPEIINHIDHTNFPLELTALDPAQIENYIVGPTETPEAIPDEPGDSSLMVDCPECGHNFDARGAASE